MAMYLAELLQRSRCIDEITIVVPRNVDFLKGLLGKYPFISVLEVSRRRGWTQLLQIIHPRCVVILQPNLGKIPLRIKILGWLITRRSGSELIGFQDKGFLCKALYSKTLVYDTEQLYGENIHNIIRLLGAPAPARAPNLEITPSFDHRNECGLYQRRYIVFHPGTSIPGRSLTIKGIRKVVTYVLERSSEMHVVLSGGPADRNWIDEIRNGMQRRERIITAIGYSAPELAGLIKSAELYLGMDTGISHLACFLRARAIVAAHPGTAANWLPFYCSSATVLYRLKEENVVHTSREYLDAKRRGRVKPFGPVPANAICAAVDGCLDGRSTGSVLASNLVLHEISRHENARG